MDSRTAMSFCNNGHGQICYAGMGDCFVCEIIKYKDEKIEALQEKLTDQKSEQAERQKRTDWTDGRDSEGN